MGHHVGVSCFIVGAAPPMGHPAACWWIDPGGGYRRTPAAIVSRSIKRSDPMAKPGAMPAGLDDHAKKLAAGLAKGRLPQPTPELERFLLTHSTEIFAAAEGVCRNMPLAGDDEALGV